MGARAKAVAFAVGELKAPCLMGFRGDLRFDRKLRTLLPHGLGFHVWDCSGLVCGAIHAAGGKDMRGTHNAQMLFDGTRELLDGEPPLPGDLAFYGTSGLEVIHVAMICAGGKVVSADGATWGIQTLEQAKVGRCAVRLHEGVHFRGDFVSVRKNTFLDEIDAVCR